jgi:hypothetical protein
MRNPKLNRSVAPILATMLLLSTTGIALAQIKTTPAKPTTAASPRPQPTNPNPSASPTHPAANQPPNQPSVWAALLSLLKRQEPPLASRSRLCPITPGLLGDSYIIWNHRPLFAWQGEVKSIEVRPYSIEQPFDSQPILWQKTLNSEVRQVSYDGPPLQPGQKYDWQIVDAAGIPRRYSFALMTAQEQQHLASHLSHRLQQLQAARATPIQIATARAQFFAEQQLWSDAMQEMYSYTNNTANTALAPVSTTQEMSQYVCTGR